MARYSLRFKTSVAKDLRRLPKKDIARILKRIEGLKDDPRGAGTEKMTGKSVYRARQGQYHILYKIHDNELVILVIKTADRRVVYR